MIVFLWSGMSASVIGDDGCDVNSFVSVSFIG